MGNAVIRTGQAYAALGCSYACYRVYTSQEHFNTVVGYVRPLWVRVYGESSSTLSAKRRDLEAIDQMEVLELWADCGQLFTHYPETIDLWHGVEPNPNLHPTIEDEALKVGIPRSTLEITPEDPIEYLKRAGDATTDSVVSSRYLDEISECDVLLREAYRVIKPGGSIVAWYRTGSRNKCSIESYSKFLEEVGFTGVEVEQNSNSMSSLVGRKSRGLSHMSFFFPGAATKIS